MHYSVTYGQDFFSQPKLKSKTVYRNVVILVIAFLIAGILMTVPKIRISVRNFLLPGDGAVTAQAIEAFVAGMKSGISFEDAAEAFCLQILQNG